MKILASVPVDDKKQMILLYQGKKKLQLLARMNFKEAKYLRDDIDFNLTRMEKPK